MKLYWAEYNLLTKELIQGSNETSDHWGDLGEFEHDITFEQETNVVASESSISQIAALNDLKTYINDLWYKLELAREKLN